MRMFGVIALAISFAGCTSGISSRSRTHKPKTTTTPSNDVAPDANGVVSSKYSATSQSPFAVNAKDAGAISGAGVSMAPGTLSIDTNVSLQEGSTVVSADVAADLGLGASNATAAGPAVLIGADDPTATIAGQMAITLPLTPAAGLKLDDCHFTVFYRIKDDKGANSVGAYAEADVTATATTLSVAATAFGVYQAACVSVAIAAPVSKASDVSPLSKNDFDKLPAVVWKTLAPVYDSAARSFDVTPTAEGIGAGAVCFATIDENKTEPFDQHLSVTLGKAFKIASTKVTGYSLFVRFDCKEVNGRRSQSEWSAAVSFAAVPTPVVKITAPAGGAFVNSSSVSDFIVQGTCSPNGITVTVAGSAKATAMCTDGAWSTHLNLSTAPQGQLPLVASANNGVASENASVSYVKDTGAPGKPAAPTDLGAFTLASPVFHWTAVSDSGTGVASYDLEFGTTADAHDLLQVNATGTSYTYAGGADGDMIFMRLRARDLAGNTSDWSTSSDGIKVDTVVSTGASALHFSATSNSGTADTTDNDGAIFLIWTAGTDVGSGIANYVPMLYPQGSCGGTPTVYSSQTGTYKQPLTLADGTYSFKVKTTDVLGNNVTSACSAGIVVDKTPPPAPSPAAVPGAAPGTIALTLTYPGTTSDYATVRVFRGVGGTAPASCTTTAPEIQTITSAFTPSTATSFNDIIGGMSLAKFAYRACAFDAAGNVSSATTGVVNPSYNAGPGCHLPPCDPVRGTTALAGTVDTTAGTTFSNVAQDYRSVALGDLNNDGFLDVVLGSQSAPIRVHMNTGGGGGPSGIGVNIGTSTTAGSLVLADFNKDGNLDLIAAGKFFQGAGNGTFAAAQTITGFSGANGIAAGDVNNDGKLDFVIAVGTDTVFLGDGAGGFSSRFTIGDGSAPDSEASGDVALGDFNEDGWLDIFVAKDHGGSPGANSRLYLNDGAGHFPTGSNATTPMETKAVRLADLHGNGHLDAILFNGNGGGMVLLTGGGNGTFAATSFSAGTTNEWGMLAEVEANGKISAFACGAGSPPSRLLPWNGSIFGSDIPVGDVTIVGQQAYSCDVGDMDGDGKLDFVVPHITTTNDAVVFTSP